MGRYSKEDPRRNVVSFKVTDHELLLLNMVSDLFKSRSEMIRKLIFDFVFQLDPEKVKVNWDKLKFDSLRRKVKKSNTKI